MRPGRGLCLACLLFLLPLAVGSDHGDTCLPPPEPPAPVDPMLSPLELLDLGAAAVRYLRAFTTQCWLPDFNAPIAMFDNSWAVALVTIWNDLTVPSNGLGRLVTSMQLQTEALMMIDDNRPGDALSVLELAVLFTLYPVHHEPEALAAWHRSLASNDTLFASRRQSLAKTLALMTTAQASVGQASNSVDALEAAMVAGTAAGELFALSDVTLAPPMPPLPPAPRPGREAALVGSPEALRYTLTEVAQNTAAVLMQAKPEQLEVLLDSRGLEFPEACGSRSSLLRVLVPALRVPLRLVEGGSEEAVRVEVPPNIDDLLQPQPRTGPPEVGDVARLGAIFADVVATLQQPLLSDIGIKCSDATGRQQLHMCREQSHAQFESWGDGEPVVSDRMFAMLAHVLQIEEALWRLDQVLDRAMTGVRLGDGTTWVKHRGYTWVLGSYMSAKLYPHGQGTPQYYQTRRPSEPQVGSTICLDKTYLLDTVLRLDQEGLRGLQYALDNLHYAQFHAGGQEAFWHLLSKDNPLCSGAACQTGDTPLASLVTSEGGSPLPDPPRPMIVDFRFVSEQQLQANLAAATDPSYRVQDPFVAAFLSFCFVSCAGLYLYTHRGRIRLALTPGLQRHNSVSASGEQRSALAQRRNSATAALREALAGDNISRQNVTKLHAAIDLAEATGVEKPLVRKAKSALQALKRRKQHGGSITGTGNAAANPNPPIGHSQSRLQQQSGLASQAGGLSAAAAAGRTCHSSGTSDMSGCPSGSSDLTSSSRSLSASSAALYSAAAAAATAAGLPGGWPEANSEESSLGQQHTEESEASCESGASTSHVAASPNHAGKAAAAARTAAPPLVAGSAASGASGGGAAALFFTPPQAPHLAAVSSETPNSPGTPVESPPRTGGSQTALSSPRCSPLAAPLPAFSQGRLATTATTAGQAAAMAAPGAPPPRLDLPHAAMAVAAAASAAAASDALVHVSLSSLAPPEAVAAAEACASQEQQRQRAAMDSSPGSPSLQHTPRGPPQLDAAAQSRLTPRQQKKLLRLQQKHAAAAAGRTAPPSLADSEEQEAQGQAQLAAGSPGQLLRRQLSLPAGGGASPAKPKLPRPSRMDGLAQDDGEAREQGQQGEKLLTKQLSRKELQALAARQESFPSKLPRSAKKKAGKERQSLAGAGSGSDASMHAGRQAGGGSQSGGRSEREVVRRTVSDPLCADSLASPLRPTGAAAAVDAPARGESGLLPHEARARHMSRWPAASQPLWSPGGSETTLNANAPEFSPSPSRPPQDLAVGSPPQQYYSPDLQGLALATGYGGTFPSPAAEPSALGCSSGGLRHSPFIADSSGRGLLRTHSVPFSPNSSLSYITSSNQSSIDPQQSAAAALAAAAAAPGSGGGGGGLGQPSLLVQLQQIWGGGAGDSVPLPGFGAGVGPALGLPSRHPVAIPAGSEQQQQQQQLAALMYMQQLELQQRLAGGGGGGGGSDSAPVSPHQLPATSADVLRQVLGSPLSPLPGSRLAGGAGGGQRDGGAAAWAALEAPAAGSGGELGALEPAASLQGSMSLSRELAQAQLQVLRQLGEATDDGSTSEGGGGGGSRRRSLALAAQRASLDLAALRRVSPVTLQLAAHCGSSGGGGGGGGTAAEVASSPPATMHGHRIDSFDLEALGFTESGE
ncbi:hypothetical protein D9Q98_006995 [Chlorella vulgaris]|uniref:Guanylate cyclase domain-containing protein n=1 Tax=Chlorella vulgaris TaxID=3077 RepID=A0A9D4YUQ5_CHLVU|nr:hypothetical protein D9Q98_006995 [Chlorella vulgaris]